jgi:hypothetical protein
MGTVALVNYFGIKHRVCYHCVAASLPNYNYKFLEVECPYIEESKATLVRRNVCQEVHGRCNHLVDSSWCVSGCDGREPLAFAFS